MVEVTQQKYPINPTTRWTTEDGRLTSEAQRIMRAVSVLLEAITIEDGEIVTDLIADAAVSASVVATSAGPVSLDTGYETIQTVAVSADGGAVLVNVTANIWSALNAPNDTFCTMRLMRNGVEVTEWIAGHIWSSSGDTAKRFSRTYNYRDGSPGTGSITYTVEAKLDSNTGRAYDISLVVTNLKK